MARRHCSCGNTHPTGEPCRILKAAHDRRRDIIHGNSSQRGYDAAWQALRRQVIDEDQQCRHCGHTGSPTNPLTGDHIIPLTRGGARLDRGNVQCLCRTCNSTKRSNRTP